MRSVAVPIVGIVVAAALDNRWSWGTVASVLVALYCHRLYGRLPAEVVIMRDRSLEDELRPGWAARWHATRRNELDEIRDGRHAG
ncbi:MAG: hypothetical protein JF922_12255 [Candidatus Dormibacteraeota bacterium]|uniref:Uncharacterized protein n=1 Tax=Candidatus Nephthysia bennettiae TaxID=3127016 RepID=A0A934KAN6_9BACT|nr:hypothetical protein [Candidatus Dormibacteraeota bacterium]MBJ7613488.1 hypothetical protein [Candidatus Dormibacteraeota bacterium]